jgi:hypothetical protein
LGMGTALDHLAALVFCVRCPHTPLRLPVPGKYSGGDVPPGSRFALETYKGLADKKLKERRAQLDAVDKLAPIAKELDCSLAQVGSEWMVVFGGWEGLAGGKACCNGTGCRLLERKALPPFDAGLGQRGERADRQACSLLCQRCFSC